MLLSFGGPEGPDDVMPFLRNVTRGRDVSDERLAVVAEQYALFGGRSPLNDQCRDLLAALRPELDDHGIDLPLYWGNRNWDPYLADTVAAMAADGVTDALVFATSAFGTYSGCRQYREDMERAAAAVDSQGGPAAPRLSKLRLFYNHPGFVEAAADRLVTAVGGTPPGAADRIVFTAHSIPRSMAAGCSYEEQLHEAARLVLGAAGWGDVEHDVVFQSRSGPPQVPWLEPDVNDHLRALAAAGTERVVLVPIGFVSDHMEVVFDLDTQARATADELGLELVRVPTVGTHPRFVAGIRELIEERLRPATAPRLALGADGPWPDECPAGHCPAPSGRPPRPADQARPAE
ncbi:MAG: ferrochelatase [Acidimicrobiales bacterium]